MSTMKDIAKQAQVSIATVSNVINGNYSHVSPENVSKIQQIIQELNYVPNMSARSLVKNSSRIIGVINYLASRRGKFLQDPFHAVLVDSIEKNLSQKGYYMMVKSVDSEEELLTLLRCWGMDGFIITGSVDNENFEGLLAANKPFVLVDTYVKTENVMSVGLEDYQGGYLATKYLIDRGHRNIVFASPKPIPGGVINERYRGYKNALESEKIKLNPKNIYYQDPTVTEGIKLGHKLSKRRDITAVVTTADMLAAGVISGLRDRNIKVPDDISVIGFDDLEICILTAPRLTTVHQDPQIKGQLVAEMIVRSLTGKQLINPNIVLPVNLVERESVRTL